MGRTRLLAARATRADVIKASAVLGGAAAAALAGAVACVPGGSAGPQGGARTDRLGPATLRFAGWWSQQQAAVYEAQARAFSEQQPNVRIQLEQFSFGVDKILVQIAGGDAPDVYWVNNDQTPAYAAVGGLLDLGPPAARDRRQLGTFLDGSQAQYVYRGKQSVPRLGGPDLPRPGGDGW